MTNKQIFLLALWGVIALGLNLGFSILLQRAYQTFCSVRCQKAWVVALLNIPAFLLFTVLAYMVVTWAVYLSTGDSLYDVEFLVFLLAGVVGYAVNTCRVACRSKVQVPLSHS